MTEQYLKQKDEFDKISENYGKYLESLTDMQNQMERLKTQIVDAHKSIVSQLQTEQQSLAEKILGLSQQMDKILR